MEGIFYMVKAFSYCGAKIALCHAPEASPEAVKAALAESLTEAKAFEIDMNDQDHMDVIRDRVVEAFGKIEFPNDSFFPPGTADPSIDRASFGCGCE